MDSTTLCYTGGKMGSKEIPPQGKQPTLLESERFLAEGRPFKTQTVHKAGLGRAGVLRKTETSGTEGWGGDTFSMWEPEAGRTQILGQFGYRRPCFKKQRQLRARDGA